MERAGALRMPDIEEIKSLIKEALTCLWQKDRLLIEKKVKEECINHKFACYLERTIEIKGLCYNVDLEYNKNYDNPKEIIDESGNKKSIRPDIVIHVRDSNDNLICFEIKKGYTDNKKDLGKVKRLLKAPYSYSYGCLVSYLPDKKYFKVKLLSQQDCINENWDKNEML